MDQMITSDLYMRHTDNAGRSHVMHHRVWSSVLFVETRQKEAALNGGSAERITVEQYRSER